jgi:PAS domain S-box-containing protein
MARESRYSQQILAELEAVSSRIKDAERGHEGYLLTGDQDAFDLYQRASGGEEAGVRASLNRLKELVDANPAYADDLVVIEEQLLRRLSILARVLDLDRDDGRDAALRVLQGGEGKRSMTSLLVAVERVRRAETGVLEGRSADAADHTQVLFRTIILGAIVSLSLMAFALFVDSRDRNTRRRAAEEVRRQREWLEVALMGIADGVIATDDAGRIDLLNPVAQALTGWSRAEAVGRDIGEVFHVLDEETHEPAESPVAVVLGKSGEFRLPTRPILVSRDGIERPIDNRAAPIRDRQGKKIGAILVFQDVTGRRETEAALLRSRCFLESVLHALPNQVAVLDEKGDILAVNQAWISFAEDNGLGDPRHGVGQNYLAVCRGMMPDEERTPSEGPAAVPIGEAIAEVISGKRDFFWLEYACHSATTRRWFLLRVTRYDSDGGRGVIVSHENITPWVLAEQEVRRANELLRKLASASLTINSTASLTSVVQVITDEARRIIGTNQAVSYLLEKGNREVHAVSLSDEVTGAAPRALRLEGKDIHAVVLENNRPVRMSQAELEATPEWRALTQADEELPMRGWLAAPFFGRGRQNLGVIQLSDKSEGDFNEEDEAVLVQLSQIASVAIENVRLADRLRESDRQKDEFMAMMAHELRNPLGPMRNAIQILNLGKTDAQTMRWALDLLERQTTHMAHMVNDLLDTSRMSRGKVQLQLGPLDLVALVRTAAEDRRPALEAVHIGLTLDLPAEAIWVRGDPTRLAQVMGNLLHNAGKFTQPGGTVDVRLRAEEGTASVSVQDTGAGMGPAMLSRLFDPFSQGEHSLARTQGGLGLGLALVKGLVELHHGRVEATSPGLGRGTTIAFHLPREHPPIAAVEDRVADNGVPHAHRILVIEDNPDAAESMQMMLELFGHEVRIAATGPDGVTAARSYRPDVILCDLGLPGISGFEVARILRGDPALEGATLVAVSGYGEKEDHRKALASGFDKALVKPVDPGVLRELLEQV